MMRFAEGVVHPDIHMSLQLAFTINREHKQNECIIVCGDQTSAYFVCASNNAWLV